MAERHHLYPVLENCERAFRKYHHPGALDAAAHLRAVIGLKRPGWMNDALAEPGLHGKPKKKPGPRGDWLRDDAWFNMVEEHRDDGSKLNSAIEQVAAELNHHGETIRGREIDYDRLLKVYNRHRKKVTKVWMRGAGWQYVPRARIWDDYLSTGRNAPEPRNKQKISRADSKKRADF